MGLILMPRPYIPLNIRFEEKYIPEPNSGCWLWLGTIEKTGYGRISIGQKNLSAHRASWELHRGSIPHGLYVLHKCDNRTCVNPEHLFLGTQKENIQDMMRKGRRKDDSGINNPRSKLSAKDVKLIRQQLAAGMSGKALSKIFRINPSTVSSIKHKTTWKHIDE